MSIYFILFFAILFFVILDNKLTKQSKSILFFGIGIILILFAGLRSPNVDFDYILYQLFFKQIFPINTLFTNSKLFYSIIKIEPSLLIIFSFAKTFFVNGLQISIFLYAFISISLKLNAIYKMTDYFMYTLLIYFSGIFLLQDMTQIRAAVAVGLILLSLPKIEEKKYIQFLIYISLAILFHYSAIIFLPFIFLNTKNINKMYYVFLIFIPLVLSVLKLDPINIISKMNLGIISEKFTQYITLQKSMKLHINIFNFNIIIQIVLSLFFIFYSENVNNKYAIILTKINCYSIAFFYLFAAIPVIAFRTNELLSSVQIILIPFLIYIIKPKVLAESIVVVIAFLILLNQLLVNPIINSYSSLLFQ
ncbi:MAG TPA: EpsG family protein [Candidatus Paceibacterota bacterium]